MIENVKLQEYYYFNIHIPTVLPKKVRVRAIDRNIVFFDQEPDFSDLTVVECLFDTYTEAIEKFAHLVLTESVPNFIDESDKQKLLEEYPEYKL